MDFCPKCSNKNGNGRVRLQSVSPSEDQEKNLQISEKRII